MTRPVRSLLDAGRVRAALALTALAPGVLAVAPATFALAPATFALAPATFALAPVQTLRLPPADPAQEPSAVLAPSDWLAGPGDARDETGAGTAFVEIHAARARAFAGETLSLEVRFGLDAVALRDDLIPLFRRALDVPVLIEAGWLATAGDAPAADGSVTVACNGRVARARELPERTIGGRAFRVFALAARAVEREPGTRTLAAPRLVYARAVGWTDDFVRGRTPLARQDAYVRGEPLAIEVEPLPEAGRPPEFSGAVGRFRADARVTWSGDATARYELALSGDGELSEAFAPDAAAFPGFALRGLLDDRGANRRSLVYDLELIDAAAIAPLRFHAFDPTPPGAYVVVETRPFEVPADARARRAATADPADANDHAPMPSFGVRVGVLAGVVALLLACVGALVSRRHAAKKGN